MAFTASWKISRCVGRFPDAQRAVKIVVRPLDHLANASVGLGRTNMTCNILANLLAGVAQHVSGSARMLERLLDQGRRIARLLDAHHRRASTFHQSPERTSRAALRFNEQESDKSARLKGMRRIRRDDDRRSRHDLIVEMKFEFAAKCEGQLERMVCMRGVAFGPIKRACHVEYPEASPFPECNPASGDLLHRWPVYPTACAKQKHQRHCPDLSRGQSAPRD